MRTAGLFILALIFFSSCKGGGSLTFCEGKKPDGSGVNCGSVFTTGDVMILVKGEETFDADKLKVEIFEESKGKKKLRETLQTRVKPEQTTTSLLVPLYSEGTFTLTASTREKNIGSGTITMRHQ